MTATANPPIESHPADTLHQCGLALGFLEVAQPTAGTLDTDAVDGMQLLLRCVRLAIEYESTRVDRRDPQTATPPPPSPAPSGLVHAHRHLSAPLRRRRRRSATALAPEHRPPPVLAAGEPCPMADTAADIKILSPAETAERFLWDRARELAQIHRHVPEVVIERLLIAAELSGVDEALAIAR